MTRRIAATLIDREAQCKATVTGIRGVNTQDYAVQESMDRIMNCTIEHLGQTDRAIVVARKLLNGDRLREGEHDA